jgi:hypothetical protein
MVEYWKNGFWPPDRGAYASERILEGWVNGVIVLTIKLKMDNILLKTHYSIIPQFHYSRI